MRLRDFVEFITDPIQGVNRRTKLNQGFHALVSKKNLSPPARVAVYSMDFPGRVMSAAKADFTDPQEFAQWQAKYAGWELTQAEEDAAKLPPTSPCFQAGTSPEWPGPKPRLIRIEPASVSGGTQTIKLIGEGLIPEVIEAYFVSKKTQQFVAGTPVKNGASGNFRCGTVAVKVNLPNVADVYALNVLNRADYLAFELPSAGIELTVTPGPAAKKKASKKASKKKPAAKKKPAGKTKKR